MARPDDRRAARGLGALCCAAACEHGRLEARALAQKPLRCAPEVLFGERGAILFGSASPVDLMSTGRIQERSAVTFEDQVGCRHGLSHHPSGIRSFAGRGACRMRHRTGSAALCRGRGHGRASAAARRDHRRGSGPRLRLDGRLLAVGGRPPRVGAGSLGGSAPGTALGRSSMGATGRRLAYEAGALGTRPLSGPGPRRRLRLGLSRSRPGRDTDDLSQRPSVGGIEPMFDEAEGY